MDRADRMAALFNILPVVLGGYFDDFMLGGIVGLCDELTDAINVPYPEVKNRRRVGEVRKGPCRRHRPLDGAIRPRTPLVDSSPR